MQKKEQIFRHKIRKEAFNSKQSDDLRETELTWTSLNRKKLGVCHKKGGKGTLERFEPFEV
jgi:hypothetical protein